jgi:ABC-type phosphate/phosphonate transport system ATPase subunit
MNEGIDFTISEINSNEQILSEHPFQEYRDKIELIKRQTNYTDDEFIVEKLKYYNGNEINVIKEYMGIPLQKKQSQITSLNQEIYRQIREHSVPRKKPYGSFY